MFLQLTWTGTRLRSDSIYLQRLTSRFPMTRTVRKKVRHTA